MVSINGEDVEAFTPGHFLIGHPICALPDQDCTGKPMYLLCRWHLCQQMTQHFWKRWADKCLITTRCFYKWKHPQRNLQVGDVNHEGRWHEGYYKWPIGRVESAHSGKDGLVRVVCVRTSKGSYTRLSQRWFHLLRLSTPSCTCSSFASHVTLPYHIVKMLTSC